MAYKQSSAVADSDPNEWQVFQSKATRRKNRYIQAHIPRAPPLPDALDRPVIRASRHEFKPPLAFRIVKPHDRSTLDAAMRCLNEYNIKKFARFRNPLKIWPLSMRPQYNTRLGDWTTYFTVGRVGLMARLPLFILPSNSYKNARLCVASEDATLTFIEWLDSLPDPNTSITGPAGYEALYQYHRARSKLQKPKHTFSTMPDDIQKNILLHMVGEVRPVSVYLANWPVVTHRIDGGRNGYVHDRWGGRISTGPPTIEPLDCGVLCLDKRTNGMIKPILKFWTIKSFECSLHLTDITRSYNVSSLSSLSRIQLCFTDSVYLSFFGVNLINTPVEYGPFDANELLKLPNLRYLELWFPSTIDTRCGNPWHQVLPSHYYEQGWQYPCRKGMIDAIMVAALPYIQHITSINLTGYVKTETRDFWLREWPKRRSDAFQVAMEEKKAALNLPPHLVASPLRCKCPVSCFYRHLAESPDGYDTAAQPSMREIKAEKQACKEAIENYRFDFDDVERPQYREVDFFPASA